MVFPSENSFLIEAALPGETTLMFSPNDQKMGIKSILRNGENIISGKFISELDLIFTAETGSVWNSATLKTIPGETIEDIAIVLGPLENPPLGPKTGSTLTEQIATSGKKVEVPKVILTEQIAASLEMEKVPEKSLTEQIATSGKQEEAPRAIAVLPFVGLSFDSAQENFADAFPEELLHKLAKISELRVTSRTASFKFRGSDKTLQEIASILGVEYLLEGSVGRSGNFLLVTVQLTRPADGTHLWAKTYDRELKNIFTVQEDIATDVANSLKRILKIEESI